MTEPASPTEATINLWDDYSDDDGQAPEQPSTFAYLESDVPDEEAKKLLRSLESRIQGWAFACDQPIETALEFYDSAKKFPSLVGTENEVFLFKRWQLNIRGMTHAARERFVGHIESLPVERAGYNITLISES